MPRYGLSLQDVRAVSRHLREEKRPALTALTEAATAPGLSPSGQDGVARLAADIAGPSPRSSAWDFLSPYLLDRPELSHPYGTPDLPTARMPPVHLSLFTSLPRL